MLIRTTASPVGLLHSEAFHVTASVVADKPGSSAAKSRCEARAKADFTDIRDAPSQVVITTYATPEGPPAYCEVQGYIAPQIGLELRLPAIGWNGKFIEVGCSGWCVTILIEAFNGPLGRGYACIASDMGHKATCFDVLWSRNNLQAQIDCGYRATHVCALADWLAAISLEIPFDPTIPVTFTRPVFPYPTMAKYRGTGDPNDAVNFVPMSGLDRD